MNKKGQIGIMGIFITLLIGLVAFSVANPLIYNKITTTTATHDTFTASNSSCTTVSDDLLCIQSLTATVNASNGFTINTANFTICSASAQGDGLILDGDASSNAKFNGYSVNATYTERDCQPITGTAGTIIGYVPLLFAVILFIFVAVQIK